MTKIYFPIFILLLMLASCSDWLDVRSKSEIDIDDMFASADGYYTALTGVYVSMGGEDLYAGMMTISGLEVLSQQYVTDLSTTAGIDRQAWIDFEYTTSKNEKSLATLWQKMYNTIVNSNILIAQLDRDELPYFEEGVVSILKAEGLALRAYLYFDLVRIFNKSYIEDPKSNNVPFKTDFGANIGEQLTSEQLLPNLIDDLKIAQQLLLNNDPIVTGKSYADKYIAYDRTQRMNYYAATALLARIHIYMGNYQEAYNNAKIVIEGQKFRFIEESEIIEYDAYNRPVKIDRTFISEMIFGLNSKNLLTASKQYLEGLSCDFVKSLLAYEASDIRRNWFYVNPSAKNKINLIRYQQSESSDDTVIYPEPIIPLLKLSEMYLIVSESIMEDNTLGGSAIEYLNDLKIARKANILSESATNEEVEAEIRHEYICDFKGEGQLFLYYKRINIDRIDDGQYGGNTINMAPENYTFPLPQIEIDFGFGKN